jgi:hypothetical protein
MTKRRKSAIPLESHFQSLDALLIQVKNQFVHNAPVCARSRSICWKFFLTGPAGSQKGPPRRGAMARSAAVQHGYTSYAIVLISSLPRVPSSGSRPSRPIVHALGYWYSSSIVPVILAEQHQSKQQSNDMKSTVDAYHATATRKVAMVCHRESQRASKSDVADMKSKTTTTKTQQDWKGDRRKKQRCVRYELSTVESGNKVKSCSRRQSTTSAYMFLPTLPPLPHSCNSKS